MRTPRILSPTRFALMACALVLAPSTAAAEPWDKPGWNVTFHDEFDQGTVNPALWKKRYKWGEAIINSELQAYVDDAFTFQGDILRIVGEHKPGTYAGQALDYRSGLLASVHEQKFGYFEIRCQMPKGQGLWPAFWLLGGAGASGVNEIDIHEFLGHQPDTVYMTIHWGPSYDDGHQSDSTSYAGPDFTTAMHTFGVEWESDHVTWLVDGTERFTHAGEGVPQASMYAIANLAIGGGWPGSPDSTTPFPSYYDIDYIRIYERAEPDAGGDAAGDAAADAVADAAADTPAESSVADARTDGMADTDALGSDAPLDGTGSADAGQGRSFPGSDDDEACGCRAAGRSAPKGAWLLALWAAALPGRRRFRRCR